MRGKTIGTLSACVVLVITAVAPAAFGDCAATGCIPGGGSAGSDCVFEWQLNPPPPLSGNGMPGRKAVCYEGDPLCDADLDIGNARCTVPLTLCINNIDERLPTCHPTEVAIFEVRKPAPAHLRDAADATNLAGLENEMHQGFGIPVLRGGDVFLPGSPNATVDGCSGPVAIDVPLRQRRAGKVLKGRRTLRVASTALSGRRDTDSVKLECRPSTCGNAAVEAHEDCDDGNRDNGDGCNQGCRIEIPTPTPTVTPLPSETPTVTSTPTVTATSTSTRTPVPPTATSTLPPNTATATHTPTRSTTPTGTATHTVTATATETETPSTTPTFTETPTPSPTATHTIPAMSVQLTAFRPQSEGYGSPFQRRPVPIAENISPGVGVRINGDDDNNNGTADFADPSVSTENDLVEVTVETVPFPPPAGFEYVLRRSDLGIAVWGVANKSGPPILTGGDSETVLSSGDTTRTIWVERVTGGDTLLELVARSTADGTTVTTASVRLFAFTSVIIALGGENQSPSDPPNSNHGMFQVASALYGLGYDVHMYDEDDVNSSGHGPAYDEVVRAIRGRGIGLVAIYGYSHGGGSTHDLAERLDADRATIGTFTIPYTGYVDAIRNGSDIDIASETRRPPSAQYLVNYYERNDFLIRGDSVGGADVNVNVNSTPWGGDLGHGEIDDHPNVRAGILDPLLERVPR